MDEWTTESIKKTGESKSCSLFSTNNAVLDKVTVAEGSMDTSSTGAQRKLSFVVPAGRKERFLRRA